MEEGVEGNNRDAIRWRKGERVDGKAGHEMDGPTRMRVEGEAVEKGYVDQEKRVVGGGMKVRVKGRCRG